MKLLIAFCLVAMAVAAPAPGNDAQILRYDNDNAGYGGYRFGFEQSDGTRHESRGEIKNEGREDEYLAVTGEFAWVGPDGVTYVVRYTADQNGYQPDIQQGPGGAVPAHVASLLG